MADRVVALRSHHGSYLCAEDGGGGLVVANRLQPGPWETFGVVPQADGRVALRTDAGFFLRVEGGGGSTIDASALSAGPWESFLPVAADDGWALQTWDGQHYLCASVVGQATADRTDIGPWETWTPEPPDAFGPDVPIRSGRIRFDNRCMVDDQGPSLWIGTSLFWAVRDAWLDYLEANLDWLTGRVDFLRVLAETSDWADGVKTDPSWPDYQDRLRAVRDLAWARGLRIAWTLFGGNRLTNQEQDRVVDQVLEVCDEDPQTVQYVEGCNENLGVGGQPDRLLATAKRFADRGYPTALTSIDHAVEGVYANSAANVATSHFQRTFAEDGWRPVRQPWGYWEWPQAPGRFVNNEPIGIGSSVAKDDDPVRLSMGAIVTFVAGGSAHVVHTGAGIYGVPTTHPVGGFRPSNLWEQPTLEATLNRIAAMRAILPVDLPNWSRQNHYWSGHPWTFDVPVGDQALDQRRGCVRAYSMVSGDRWVVAPIGIMADWPGTPKVNGPWTLYDAAADSFAKGSGPIALSSGQRAAIVVRV